MSSSELPVSWITRLSMPTEESRMAGWDATIEDDAMGANTTLGSLGDNAGTNRFDGTSITKYAMAHENWVYGIRQDDMTGVVQEKEPSWISWKTSLAPHRVCQVASNEGGSLIAATLDNGTLSILRGTDGTVLATRRVAPEGVQWPATVHFVRTGFSPSGEANNTTIPSFPDTLVILPPADGPPILVSNMQGHRLNCLDNPGVVAEAARSMGLHALRLEGCDDIRAMQGLALPNDIIRLAMVDGDGHLAIYDYDLKHKTSKVIQSQVDLGSDQDGWEIDMDVGLRIQTILTKQGIISYLVLAQYMGTKTKICWIDFQDLKILREYLINAERGSTKRIRMMGVEPVPSCSPSDSLALVLAIKFPGENSKLETRIIQATIRDVLDEKGIGKPHLVYSLPVPPSICSMAISSVSDNLPYSFRCKTWSGNEKYDFHSFATRESKVSVGSLRLMCARDQFDEAQEAATKEGSEVLIKDPFAGFHPAEIALCRLEKLLMEGSVADGKAMQESQDCLRNLVAGAMSGDKTGQKLFLLAANHILEWPTEIALQKTPPSLHEISLVLNGIISAMSSVSSIFTASDEYRFKFRAFQEKLDVVQYLSQILQNEDEEKPIPVNKEFSKVRSFNDLFVTFVRNGHFLAAENMWKSNLRDKLTPEAMVSSVLDISPKQDPRHYASLLTGIVFPSLSISHELLPNLLSWACKMVDEFDTKRDDNERCLDDAIFLLELVERATKDLRLRLHSSFSKYTPFIEKVGVKRRRVGHGKAMNLSGTATDVNVLSTSLRESKDEEKLTTAISMEFNQQRPNPTILEMGRLKGGAQKNRFHQLSAQGIDTVDENEDTVEVKLMSARCLKHARSLGLNEEMVTLKNYSTIGGAQYIAVELVKAFSADANSHEEREANLSERVLGFCTAGKASFDHALLTYARDLCRGKNTSREAIREAVSVARCGTTASTKCGVTLIALRAALFCRFSPPWLSELSQKAIEWAAGDSSLRSELEEASRLLLIDGIVGRYCGEGAKELFHIDNPRHAIRLLEFVSRHFDQDSVLEDTLSLCEAFAHLSSEESCCHIIQNAILQGTKETASKLMQALYSHNISLAQATFSRVIGFCMDLIEGSAKIIEDPPDALCQERNSNKYMRALTCGEALARIALSKIHLRATGIQRGFSIVHVDESKLEDLVEHLKRLDTLREDHSIYLSLSSLQSPRILVKTISNMLVPLVEAYSNETKAESTTIVAQTRRACALLAGASQMQDWQLWFASIGSSTCRLAMKSRGIECLDFMSEVGVLGGAQSTLAARSCLAVAMSFCLKASKLAENIDSIRPAMKHVVMATSLLQDYTLRSCPGQLLEKAMSVAELCDVVTNVLIRTDEGIGEELDEFRRNLHESAAEKRSAKVTGSQISLHSLPRRLTSHPTWYVGDGLLLPPSDILVKGLQFCKEALTAPSQSDAAMTLQSFVNGRGAFGLGLRVLSLAVSSRSATNERCPSFSEAEEANHRILLSLAERYVGGTGNGIISGVVDSQMAVSLLLSLPLKMAFRVYKAALPTAISTRDFSRVVTLANIGVVAGNGSFFEASSFTALPDWKRQKKFVAQCEELALRSKWWKVLQENRVSFDTSRFQDSSQHSRDKTRVCSDYILSLIPALISSLSRSHSDPESVLTCAINFAQAFNQRQEVSVQAYVEYLLSPPIPDDEPGRKTEAWFKDDARLKLARLDTIVKSILRRLESPVDRTKVLRNSLRRLEQSGTACDYERLAVVLNLYHSELSALLRDKSRIVGVSLKHQLAELELVDRRRDALAILSWYFQGAQEEKRPSFFELFPPLPKAWKDDTIKNAPQVSSNVLGGKVCSESFDPLAPLEDVLKSSNSISAAAALAPLCLPLGVPQGYIHARSLLARFNHSKAEGAALPSFEEDVLPVLSRLKYSSDVADLAEWCSLQYDFDDEDKLRCLDHSMNFAMKASSEAENRAAHTSGKASSSMQDAVIKALDRVKRVSSAKDLLSERLAINAILKSVGMMEDHSSALGVIVKTLMDRLEEKVWTKDEFVPESFVEIFLSESSLVSSDASLCRKKALSVGQLRQLSVLVHRACQSVAEKYSHVQVSQIARDLASRWLSHGDCDSSPQGPLQVPLNPQIATSSGISSLSSEAPLNIDDDDTANFVMDLNALQRGGNWSSEYGSGTYGEDDKRLTSEEEPSSLDEHGSARERSDLSSRRISLRIAFVMAYAEAPSSTGSAGALQDENKKPATNRKANTSKLLSKLSARGSKQKLDNVLEHSRELMKIVFARSAAASWLIGDLDASSRSKSSKTHSTSSKQIITFATRHRALRAASILCPQEALQNVVQNEFLIEVDAALMSKSSFGSFVAKEVEEMGLSLPHSDLAELSTMHFPSHARTLWRHHRDDKRCKGRLLLLILELYLKERVSDFDFFLAVFHELDRLRLPRTLLMVLESITDYLNRMGPEETAPFMEKMGPDIVSVTKRLSMKIVDEASIKSSEDTGAVLSTLERIAIVVERFSCTQEGQQMLEIFIEKVLSLCEEKQMLEKSLAAVLDSLLRNILDKKKYSVLVEKARSRPLYSNIGCPQSRILQKSDGHRSQSSLADAIDRFESTLSNCQSSTIQ